MLLGFKSCSLDHALDVSIGFYLGAVEIQLFTPHQSSLDTQFHNVLKELLKDFQSKPFPDLAQAAVIGDWLIQVITDEPTVCQI